MDDKDPVRAAAESLIKTIPPTSTALTLFSSLSNGL